MHNLVTLFDTFWEMHIHSVTGEMMTLMKYFVYKYKPQQKSTTRITTAKVIIIFKTENWTPILTIQYIAPFQSESHFNRFLLWLYLCWHQCTLVSLTRSDGCVATADLSTSDLFTCCTVKVWQHMSAWNYARNVNTVFIWLIKWRCFIDDL